MQILTRITTEIQPWEDWLALHEISGHVKTLTSSTQRIRSCKGFGQLYTRYVLQRLWAALHQYSIDCVGTMFSNCTGWSHANCFMPCVDSHWPDQETDDSGPQEKDLIDWRPCPPLAQGGCLDSMHEDTHAYIHSTNSQQSRLCMGE